jgi:hypothetical protein
MDIRDSFCDLCNFLVEKKHDFFNLFTVASFGGFKSKHTKHYETLKKLVTEDYNTEFSHQNFVPALAIIFNHLRQTFIEDNDLFKDHQAENLFHVMNFLLSPTFQSNQIFKFEQSHMDAINDFKTTTHSIFNNVSSQNTFSKPLRETRSSININAEIELLKTQFALSQAKLDRMAQDHSELLRHLKQLQPNGSSTLFSISSDTSATLEDSAIDSRMTSSTVTSTSQTAPVRINQELYNKLFNIADKMHRYNEHIRIAETHLENGTTPPSLFFNRFPVPFLADDQAYLDVYNDLCEDFQHKALKQNIFSLQSRIATLGEELNNLKHKHNIPEDFFIQLESKVKNKLQDIFERNSNKCLRANVVKWSVTTSHDSERRHNRTERNPYAHQQRKDNFRSTSRSSNFSNNQSSRQHRNTHHSSRQIPRTGFHNNQREQN